MFPARNSQQRQGSSKKIPLKPGRSLVDWIRLTKSGKDLKGTGPRLLRITTEELAKHNKPNDLWMALRGMVYNVTQYMEYHPGGADELMRGAGIDATSLFEEVHRWVNYESMLKECLIGKLVEVPHPGNRGASKSTGMLAPPPPSATSLNPLGVNSMKIDTLKVSNSAVPQIKLQDFDSDASSSIGISIQTPQQTPLTKQELSHDWYQTNKTIVFVIYTKRSHLESHQIVCDIQGQKQIFIDVLIDGTLHSFSIALEEHITQDLNITVTQTGKAQITLVKFDPSIHWKNIGSIEHSAVSFSKQNIADMRFVNCVIRSKSDLTHDTSLYHVKFPPSRWMRVPIGFHVYIKSSIDDLDISRPYTPVLQSLLHEDAEALLSTGQNLYLAIKHYTDGAVTSCLKSKEAGDEILLSTYDGDFNFEHANKFDAFIMLAAGTGITPMVRVLYSFLHNQDDKQVHLLFFNKEEKDIIYRHEFQNMEQDFKGRFYFENILSRPGNSWRGKSGRISKEIIGDYVATNPNFQKENLHFFICGPNEFTKLGKTILNELGFTNFHAFM